ncbi:hypothetical protein SADUNF_Sadunf05G0008200 [Salix dunnii]|uniref:Lon proteolytic domain-containing protein n=1 Tax=Salix dunnii TaxID=1413687 RepID=A0A835N3F3_9ROSI|nr:hypothetical protein SADUNF_Sadunf05G0008200 [Salix dunnii]
MLLIMCNIQVKEKTQTARRSDVKTIIFPSANRRDFDELSPNSQNKVELRFPHRVGETLVQIDTTHLSKVSYNVRKTTSSNSCLWMDAPRTSLDTAIDELLVYLVNPFYVMLSKLELNSTCISDGRLIEGGRLLPFTEILNIMTPTNGWTASYCKMLFNLVIYGQVTGEPLHLFDAFFHHEMLSQSVANGFNTWAKILEILALCNTKILKGRKELRSTRYTIVFSIPPEMCSVRFVMDFGNALIEVYETSRYLKCLCLQIESDSKLAANVAPPSPLTFFLIMDQHSSSDNGKQLDCRLKRNHVPFLSFGLVGASHMQTRLEHLRHHKLHLLASPAKASQTHLVALVKVQTTNRKLQPLGGLSPESRPGHGAAFSHLVRQKGDAGLFAQNRGNATLRYREKKKNRRHDTDTFYSSACISSSFH